MYPLETILCGGLLIWFRYEYNFRRLRKIVFTILVRPLIFAVWISPQQFLGFPAGNAGVNPDIFADQPSFYFTGEPSAFGFCVWSSACHSSRKIFGADFCCAF
jgi:hypothetical protein